MASHVTQLEEKVKEMEQMQQSMSSKLSNAQDTLMMSEETLKSLENRQQGDISNLLIKVEDGLETMNKKIGSLNEFELNLKEQLASEIGDETYETLARDIRL